MRGDFSSSWKKEKGLNLRGTLHQQGRVMTDRDGNALTEHFNQWQEVAGQDIIGAGVAAVPADAPESFKVINAAINSDGIDLSIETGRVWADGLLINLVRDEDDDENVVRKATYLKPPIQDPEASLPNNPPNSPILRDAVILEAWCEELNAFQKPELLIEPALGGVDTTERVNTAFRFRLYRMEADDTCDSIIGQLDDDFASKGKLTVTLDPDNDDDEECPVNAEGGYTGFEHQLYRLEVAQTDDPDAFFKWSQFNGGLVGRGDFQSADNTINITSNKNAIMHSGLTEFYLEAVKFDEEQGFWKVVYGGKAKLNISEQTLELSTDAADVFFDSNERSDGENIFFRLWNGIFPVSEFVAEATALKDGIHLQFEADAVGKYTPHDYWTFEVRAGEIESDQVEMIGDVPTLINNLPPEGIFYHRVPLAELNWTDDPIDFQSGDIEDCRRIFQPLTKLSTCCTYRVGDGTSSHGDFTSIQKAINNLPLKGGQICVLPGEFKENIVISAPRNRNIHIKGCGNRSRIVADKNAPVIHVKGGENIRIESLFISASEEDEGVGILLEGDEISANRDDREKRIGLLRNITLKDLQILAFNRSAIEMHVGQFVSIRNCQVLCKDVGGEWAAVYLAGDDLLFEDNEIRVITKRQEKIPGGEITNDPLEYTPAESSLGGLHLSGGCERVRVIDNLIFGGTSNGINLGSVDVVVDEVIVTDHRPWFTLKDICDDKPTEVEVPKIDERTRFIAGAPLRDILIENNRIFSMGNNGIGVEAFFVVEESAPGDVNQNSHVELISVDNLFILNNEIRFCLNRPGSEIKERMTNSMGFGGIALSDVENLIIRDNFITDNGPNYIEPVCGIFVLIGEAIEISRNHILNNGKLTGETTSNVKNGARGGIFILFGSAGKLLNPQTGKSLSIANVSLPFPSGLPALTLHDNVVSSPMGRALTLIASGNVSITGNQFLSQSIVPGFNLLNFAASTVLIFNLNIATIFGGTPVSHDKINRGQVKQDMSAEKKSASVKEKDSNRRNATAAVGNAQTRKEVGSLQTCGRSLLGGSTLFANNQCRIIDLGRKQSNVQLPIGSLSSVLIVSLADVGFHDNYCICGLEEKPFLTQALVLGITNRFTDNFLEEIFKTVLFSGATFGLLNTTADNQSTHCLFVRGGLYHNRFNLTFLDAVAGSFPGDIRNLKEGFCEKFDRILQTYGQGQQTHQTIRQ